MTQRNLWLLGTTAFAVLAFGVAATATATPIDFESITHGEIVTTQIPGVSISAINFNKSHDHAVGFDTTESGTEDDDLEAASSAPYWAGGNIADEALGTILILQENDTGCGDGFCDVPDDEGARPAGDLIFDFDFAQISFGFDVVDVESASAENGEVRFFVDGDDTPEAIVEFIDFVTNGNIFYDPTIEYGNRTANRIAPITTAALGIDAFTRVVIRMGGSGGIDNIEVPEASTVWLIGLGLFAAGALSRSARWSRGGG